jgi:hypothetical protein
MHLIIWQHEFFINCLQQSYESENDLVFNNLLGFLNVNFNFANDILFDFLIYPNTHIFFIWNIHVLTWDTIEYDEYLNLKISCEQ